MTARPCAVSAPLSTAFPADATQPHTVNHDFYPPYETDRFRRLLAVTLGVYAVVAALLTFLHAAPQPREAGEQFHVARLLINPEDLARQQAMEETRRQAEEEARKQAEEARRQAEEEARKQADAARRQAEEEARRQAEEEARRRAAEEQARQAMDAESRQRAEAMAQRQSEEQARKQAAEAAKLAAIQAALEAKRQREEEARRNAEAAMSAGVLGAMGDEEDDEFADVLASKPKAPLVSGPAGGRAGAPSATVPGTRKGNKPGGADDMADIDALLRDIGDMEQIKIALGDRDVSAVSREELQAFLNDVSAGRVDVKKMVARATTIVESPFKIEGEVGGSGIRKVEDIMRIIRSHRGELKHFYDKSLTRIPGLKGTVVVRMVIAPDGRVTDARVESSDTGAPAFDRELVSRVKEWTFPPVPKGVVEGTYPFHFSQGI